MELLNVKKVEGQKWGCGAVLINSEGKMLLGRRCKKNDLPQWCFVGGGIEVGETPLQGVMREINEESGMTPLSVEFVEAFEKDGVTDYLFVCRNFSGNPVPQEGELDKIGWFSLKEVEKLELFSYTIGSLSILKNKGIVRSGSPFFNVLANVSMDNFDKVLIEKKDERITIPMEFNVGFFTYSYSIIILPCGYDADWYDVVHKAGDKVFASGKLKVGATTEEISFTLKDIIQQIQATAMRMTKIDFDYWKDNLKD